MLQGFLSNVLNGSIFLDSIKIFPWISAGDKFSDLKFGDDKTGHGSAQSL